jgi:hypothetical protein
MKRRSTFTGIAILFFQIFILAGLPAQTEKKVDPGPDPGFCAQAHVMDLAQIKSVKLRTHQEQIERQAYEFFTKKSPTAKGKSIAPDYILPVVVHIIHDGGAENISDATVLQGIQDLNDAYANVGYYDPATGVDTKIQFCLAKRNPDGNATTGINRVQSPLTDMTLETDDITVKDLSRWDPTHYINIWLVREICSASIGCGVAGYAYFPSSHGLPQDGIMMEAAFFGSSQGASGVQVHEMGHYLGLYHTFQGGCTNNDCLADGDRVCDTPPDQSTAPVPCGGTANSCSTDANSGFASDQNDLFQDYMDYGNFNCWSVFTQGQTDRMHWHIENVRSSLLESLGCLDPCTSALTASFSASTTTVDIGGTVNFTNTSVNTTSAGWEIDGTAFTNSTDASYTFNQVGSFEICLNVGNADPNCQDVFCQNITVTCPVQAGFNTNILYPQPGELVNFTNTSTAANTYTWTVNGAVVGNSADLSYAFPSTGVYDVCLKAGNGLCEAQFCQVIFAFETSGGECEGSFLRIWGNAGQTEFAHAIVKTPDGNFLIGGSQGNASLLLLVDPAGETLWARTFDLTPGNDFIFEMMLDSDGHLLLTGRDELNANTLNYVVKYDYQNDAVLWTRLLPNPAFARLEILLEKSPGGNYLVLGEADNNNFFAELNRNTGAVVNMNLFDFGNTDHFLSGLVHNGAIYTAGVQRNGGLGDIRVSMTKLDLSGNQLWTRFYLNNLNETARTYFYENLIENDTIVAYGRGDLNGTSFTDVELLLMKSTLDGDFIWAKSYDIPGSNTEFSGSIVQLPDGYILQGTHNLDFSGEGEYFLIRTDKQGFPIWARSVKSVAGDWGRYATFDNGFIYFAGRSNEQDASGDILFGKMALDGTVVGDGCEFVYEIEVGLNILTNDYDGLHPLTELSDTYPMNAATESATAASLAAGYLPGCECEEFTAGCDTTFLKSYGTPQDNETSHAIVEVPAALGGGFLLGGGKGDSAMITLLDPVGDIVWTRSFDATSDAADFIWDIKFDSDNNVIGVGNTRDEPQGNVECFAFKYNLTTNTMLWVNELDLNDPAEEVYYSIVEKSPGGNYVVSGHTNSFFLGPSTSNAILVELNRNTGGNVWQRNLEMAGFETFRRSLIANNAIYTTGGYSILNNNNKTRPGLTKLDLNGNQLWSRLYLRPVGAADNARLFATDMAEDNGFTVFGHGDMNGTSETNVSLFLFHTDYDGNLAWAMNYDLPGANSERATKILNLPDGYLCLGYYTQGDEDAFIFKTDKNGQLQWAKTYGNTGDEQGWGMLWKNSQVYLTGQSTGIGSGVSEDIWLATLSANGATTAQDSCNLFSDLGMTATLISSPYDNQHNLSALSQNWGNFFSGAIMGETAVQSTVSCFTPCIDSCDLVPDAVFQNATAACQGAQLSVSVTVCNSGNFNLPAGTPVSFYDSDPTAGAASVIATLPIPAQVGHGDCETFDFTITGSPNMTYFILINDDGTTATPIDLTTFEADETECNYVNNLGSFTLGFTPPVLDLGPDVSMCDNGVTNLDAGPGFASYLWNDGTTEQTLTAWNAGTYWVTATDSCGGIQSDTITISIDPATVLDLGPDLDICEGGSYTFDVSGFTTFEWLPADFLSCSDCPNPTTTPTADITYTLIATNAAGCISVDSVTVTVVPGIETSEQAAVCEGDTIFIFGNLVTMAGDYTETFTSTSGCDSTHTVTLTVLPVVESIEDVKICEGDTVLVFGMPVFTTSQFSQTYTSVNGCDSIHTISVGVIPNVFTEETISICFGETADIFGVPVSAAGVYEMTFPAANTCDSTHTITLVVNDEILLEFLSNNVTCFGGSDGSLTASATGGSGNFTYLWASGETTPSLTGLAAGTYSVTTTDASGCTASASFEISQPAAVQVTASGVDVSCNELGSASATASGGTGSITFAWSTGSTAATVTGLTAGIYSVTATDENGCTGEASVEITGALGPAAAILIDAAVSQVGASDGALTASVSGGTPPFSYDWSNSETTAALDGLPSGAYTVTVTDANGCTATATAYLYVAACTGGKIWNDMDRDGCQDGGEFGMAGVVLNLTGTDIWGNPVTATTTSAFNGEYIFENLPPGTYNVSLAAPAGFNISPANACMDDFTDSDFSPTGMTTSPVVLVEGHCCLIVDGGLFDTCLNITTVGEICCDQTLCGPGNDPGPITSISPATGGGGPTQYMWMYALASGGGWQGIPSATGASYDPGPLSETTYFVRCAKSATCTGWLESNVVTITVDDVAVAAITPPGPICVGVPVTFTAAPNGPGATYAWNFGPWATPSASTQPMVTVTFSQWGYTNVSLTVVRNGCTSTDVEFIGISNSPVYCSMSIATPGGGSNAGVPLTFEGEMAGDERFAIFPNPTGGRLTVTWNEEVKTSVDLAILSIDGRVLFAGRSGEGDRQFPADVSALKPGVYLLRLSYGDGEQAVFKLVKT